MVRTNDTYRKKHIISNLDNFKKYNLGYHTVILIFLFLVSCSNILFNHDDAMSMLTTKQLVIDRFGEPTEITETNDYDEYYYDFGVFDMIGSSTLAPWSIVIVDTWMWTPFTMLICLAGLRSIPNYLYEAAEVDRASKWQQFIHITLPSVLPFLLLALLFRGIENFKMFDLVVELTSGGPGSATELASINLKREAFEKWKTGYSSAFAVILFVTIFGFGNVYVKVMNKIKER